MDGVHFDRLTRQLVTSRLTRAHALREVAAAAAALAGIARAPWGTDAKKKKRKRKRTICHCPDIDPQNCFSLRLGRKSAKQHLTQHPNDFPGACPKAKKPKPPKPPKSPPPPKVPEPAPSCIDGMKNGRETGVDCGGPECPRCAVGQGCQTRDDCAGAFCTGHKCQACTSSPQCGSDAAGTCACVQPEGDGPTICAKGAPTSAAVANCTECPTGTMCVAGVAPGSFDCFMLCGVP
jgi:hypothetical protein